MLLESMSPSQIIFRAWVQARTMRLADVQMNRKLQSKHSMLPYAQDTSWDTMRQLDVSLQARQVGTILRPSARRRDKVLLMQSQRPVRRFPFCSSPSGATNPSCTGKLMSPHWQELIEEMIKRIQSGMLSRCHPRLGIVCYTVHMQCEFGFLTNMQPQGICAAGCFLQCKSDMRPSAMHVYLVLCP